MRLKWTMTLKDVSKDQRAYRSLWLVESMVLQLVSSLSERLSQISITTTTDKANLLSEFFLESWEHILTSQVHLGECLHCAWWSCRSDQNCCCAWKCLRWLLHSGLYCLQRDAELVQECKYNYSALAWMSLISISVRRNSLTTFGQGWLSHSRG